jgi:hypothetical protein
MENFIVVTSHPDLIMYVDMPQKKNAEALSFYPRQVFEREANKHRIFLGLLNNQPCGYIYVGAEGRDVKCHQVCIEYDARRRLMGALLVGQMENYADKAKATSITLRCGFDLEANQFWESLGYSCIQHVQGGVRRMRTINVWRKWLSQELFTTPTLVPAIGKTDASVWRKNKVKGLVTGFSRGKALDVYRDLINPAKIDLKEN